MSATPVIPVRSPAPSPGITHVLMVCQANRCRSPFAAEIARRLADASIRFASGGLLEGGYPMPRTGVAVAARLGLDFSGHRSRELDLGDLDGFDLILTMARAQAREILADSPELFARVFTLKQFDRWIADHPKPSGVPLGAWLDRTAQDRSRASFFGDDADDDIADPIGSPEEEWISMAREMTGVLGRVTSALDARRS